MNDSKSRLETPDRPFAFDWAAVFRRYGVVVAFLILIAVVASANPAFLGKQNIFNLLDQWAPAGIMAVGMTFVIMTRGFDLSVASGFALCAVVAAALGEAGMTPEAAFLAAIGVGLAVGLLNAILVAGLNINPFIATLGTGFVLAGLPHVTIGNPFILVEDPAFDDFGTGSWGRFPFTGMLLIGFLVVGGVVLAKTPYGRAIYAVGGNPEASHLFGIRVRLITGSTYIFSGFCMGAAGVVAMSQLSYAASNIDPALVFDVIVAVVVGGTSLSGGFGAMWRTALGLAILATLENGLNLLDVAPFYKYIVKGCIIVGALGLDVLTRRLTEKTERTARRARYLVRGAQIKEDPRS